MTARRVIVIAAARSGGGMRAIRRAEGGRARVDARVKVGNDASRRAFERAGYRLRGETGGVLLFTIDADVTSAGASG